MVDKEYFQKELQPLVEAVDKMLQAILAYLAGVRVNEGITEVNKAVAHAHLAGILRLQADEIMRVAQNLPGLEEAKKALAEEAN